MDARTHSFLFAHDMERAKERAAGEARGEIPAILKTHIGFTPEMIAAGLKAYKDQAAARGTDVVDEEAIKEIYRGILAHMMGKDGPLTALDPS